MPLYTSHPAVLSLCDRTGTILEPWRDAGLDCIAVDLQHQGEEVRDGITFLGADVLKFRPFPRPYRIAFAFPPCTHLAVSGARWFGDKGLQALIDALQLVEACRSILTSLDCPWALENPVSTLSTYWRKPDLYFDPCDYGGWVNGDRYTKRTCLWCSHDFKVPISNPLFPYEGSRMHRMPPSPDRADERSVTPLGFAWAVFHANATDLERASV